MALTYLDNQLDNLRAEANAVRETFSRFRDDINSDNRLSDEAKKEDIQREKERTKARIRQLLEEEKRLVKNKSDELQRQLDGKVGSASTDIIAFRDAQDRAERLENQEEASRVLARATRNGDTSLAHAIFRRALEDGWRQVVDQFGAAHPNAAETVNDIAVLDRFQNDISKQFERAMIYSDPQ